MMEQLAINPITDPHLSQRKHVAHYPDFTYHDRVLTGDIPREVYKPRTEKNTSFHWGQRKLLMSEIEFLTIYGHLADELVYVGAGSKKDKRGISPGGVHIELLSKMFPKHTFHLYDPTDFGITETDKIKLYKQYFTNEDAQDWHKIKGSKNLLYISDIRTVDNSERDKNKYANGILSDMMNQWEWSKIMVPAASMVKFKLPYGEVNFPDTEYPKGVNFLPIWGRPTTTETRLVYEDPEDMMQYDNFKHEEQMAYFNNNILLSYYDSPEWGCEIDGFDHCYSCRSECHIISEYIRKTYGKKLSDHHKFMQTQVKNLSTEITKLLTKDKRTFDEHYRYTLSQYTRYNK